MPLIEASVVLTANKFNPSVFNQIWLKKHRIIADERDIGPGTIYSDSIVQVNATDFHLLVAPEQLQFRSKSTEPEVTKVLIDQKVKTIIMTLPHTPFKAIGLNFDWQLIPAEKENFREVSRYLFFQADKPLFKAFDSEDARFGGYLSKDFDRFRLKLDVKPIRVTQTDEFRLRFNFNFHSEIEPIMVPKGIVELLDHWDIAFNEAARIMVQIEGHGKDE